MASRLIDDPDQYADLIMSVGVQGNPVKGDRPLVPIEVARRIRRLIDENGEPLHETARRLGLGRARTGNIHKREDTTQLGRFLDLLKLSPRSSMALGFGRSDPDRIPFSTGAEIARLESHHEQDMVIQSALERGITKEEAQKIVACRRDHGEATIEQCIERILKIRPVRTVVNVACCTLDQGLCDPVASDTDGIAKGLSAMLGGEIHGIRVRGRIIMIRMDDDSFAALNRETKRSQMTLSQYVNSLIAELT